MVPPASRWRFLRGQQHGRARATWEHEVTRPVRGRATRLLAEQPDVVVSGTVENQRHFYDQFEHVVLLSAPVDQLLKRVGRRTNNPYGKTADQQADIARYVERVEPLLRRGSTLELDGRRPVGELADVIEDLVRRPTSRH